MVDKRELLFDHFNKNLNMIRADPRVEVHPDRDDMVICPLCFNKFFTLDNLVDGSLTLEHVPPESLGGKGIVLTCKDCNNNQGTQLDSFLVSHINDINALQGHPDSFIDGTVTTDLIDKVRVNFQINGNAFSIFPHRAAYQKEVQQFNKQFENGQVYSLKLTLRIANPRRAKLSLLRSAYLLAFAYMGYGFMFSHNLGPLRYQLHHPKEDIFPIQAIQFYDQTQLPDSMMGINLLRTVRGEKSYFIVFDVMKNGASHRAGVMLPGPNGRDAELFRDLKNSLYQNDNVQLRNIEISFEDKLTYPFIAHHIWNDL